MLSKILWLTGSAIFFVLGAIHLYYTFFTTKFDPRNKDLISGMKDIAMRLTDETTMWKAWKGFNASHSASALFIGLVNALLAVKYFYIIEDSFIFPFLTIVTSVFYLWLAKKYWFSIPFYGLLIATACFIISPVLSFFR
jgi:hypothetical protein